MSRQDIEITFELANGIYKGLLPLCDRVYRFYEDLHQDGFHASTVYEDYIVSFCKNSEDKDIHKKYNIEDAKLFTCRPSMSFFPVNKSQQLEAEYVSEYLKERASEVGVEYGLDEDTEKCDPCLVNLREWIRNYPQEEDPYESMHRNVARVFSEDIERHATDLSFDRKIGRRERCDFFIEAFELYGNKLGFHYDDKRSGKVDPFFFKTINAQWDLCYSILDTKEFRDKKFAIEFSPVLEIRHKQIKRARDNWDERFKRLDINYIRIVPSFNRAYSWFHTFREFETIIKAHITLLGYMLGDIENAIKRVMVKS